MNQSRPQAVELGSIEIELQQLWRSLGREGGAEGIVRTALLNWIFVEPTDAEIDSALVAEVASLLPCRVLLLRIAPDEGAAPPAATISAFCRAGAGPGGQVCCEQVILSARRSEIPALASSLLALLLPDLPTVLFWPRRPLLEGGLLERLGSAVDRVIVDSAGCSSAATDWAWLAGWRNENRVVVDLAWSRLDPWRELLAGLFDGEPFAAELDQVRSADLGYEPGGEHAALLCAGWLVSRLGWLPRRRRERTWWLDSRNGAVQLRLAESGGGVAGAGTPPSLARVALEVGAGSIYFVEPVPEHPTLLESRIDRAGTCPLPRRMPRVARSGVEPLVRALAGPGRNPAFEAALSAAVALGRMPPHTRAVPPRHLA